MSRRVNVRARNERNKAPCATYLVTISPLLLLAETTVRARSRASRDKFRRESRRESLARHNSDLVFTARCTRAVLLPLLRLVARPVLAGRGRKPILGALSPAQCEDMQMPRARAHAPGNSAPHHPPAVVSHPLESPFARSPKERGGGSSVCAHLAEQQPAIFRTLRVYTCNIPAGFPRSRALLCSSLRSTSLPRSCTSARARAYRVISSARARAGASFEYLGEAHG